MWQPLEKYGKAAAEGYDNVLMITIGTGIGGGLILNGKIHGGVTGSAAEVGHICVNPLETEPCNCGNCGCLEQYTSATGILRMAQKKTGGNRCTFHSARQS